MVMVDVDTKPLLTLELRNICHSYGQRLAVKDISLSLPQHQIFCLLGPSGCGKSTLLRLIAGLEMLQQGEIWIENQCVATSNKTIAPEKRGVGLVFQDYILFPHLTIAENIAFGLHFLPKKQRRQRVEKLLETFRLTSYIYSYPHMLSGGQQQRVALARALAPEPKLLLLDEAFSSLDVRLRAHIREQTLEIIRNFQATVLMVSHDPQEAMEMADQIAVMQQGQIVQIGEPATIYHEPNSAFVAEFFGETNILYVPNCQGVAETLWGNILLSPTLSSAKKIQLLIRAEAFYWTKNEDDGIRVRINDIRYLGQETKLHLVADQIPEPYFFYARVRGKVDQPVGAYIRVGLDHQQVFAFAD